MFTLAAQKSASRSKHWASTNQVFDNREIDWFSLNGYNLGLRGIIEWPPSQALRILTATFGFLEMYQDANPDIKRRGMLCAYLCSALSKAINVIPRQKIVLQLTLFGLVAPC